MKKILLFASLMFFTIVAADAQTSLTSSRKTTVVALDEIAISPGKTAIPDLNSPGLCNIIIRSSVVSNSSLINFELMEPTDSVRLELFNSNGDNVELLFDGKMLAGKHQFEFIPVTGISRPFIAVFTVAAKVVSMRVVKFNSF